MDFVDVDLGGGVCWGLLRGGSRRSGEAFGKGQREMGAEHVRPPKGFGIIAVSNISCTIISQVLEHNYMQTACSVGAYPGHTHDCAVAHTETYVPPLTVVVAPSRQSMHDVVKFNVTGFWREFGTFDGIEVPRCSLFP